MNISRDVSGSERTSIDQSRSVCCGNNWPSAADKEARLGPFRSSIFQI
jgi:hypothetical protein